MSADKFVGDLINDILKENNKKYKENAEKFINRKDIYAESLVVVYSYQEAFENRNMHVIDVTTHTPGNHYDVSINAPIQMGLSFYCNDFTVFGNESELFNKQLSQQDAVKIPCRYEWEQDNFKIFFEFLLRFSYGFNGAPSIPCNQYGLTLDAIYYPKK